MTENVYYYNITWTNGEFAIQFADLFDEGDEYTFTPEDMDNLHQDIGLALMRYREGM